MSTSRKAPKPLSETIKHTKEQWLQLNPFLTDEEAQVLVDNPPKRWDPKTAPEDELNHDSPPGM